MLYNKSKHAIPYIVCLCLLLLGTTFFAVGLHLFWEKETFFGSATKTTGRVAYYLDFSESGPKHMAVEFAPLKGDTLIKATRSVFWLQRPVVGSRISVWYKRTNDFTVDVEGGMPPGGLLFLIIGMLVGGLGAWGFYRTYRRQQIEAEIMVNGRLIYATFKNRERFLYLKHGKTWLYSVHATWVDPETGIEYSFFSDFATEKPSLDTLWTKPIPVYI